MNSCNHTGPNESVTALDKDWVVLEYLKVVFPKMAGAKIKAAPFFRSQKEDPRVQGISQEAEIGLWNSFVVVVLGFLGNHNNM